MMKLLLEHSDIQVNAVNKAYETPLYCAANQTNKNMEDVKLLISQGANMNLANKWGNKPHFDEEELTEILDSSLQMASHKSKLRLELNEDTISCRF